MTGTDMSATRRQKAARQEQHRRDKEKRRLEKLFAASSRKKEVEFKEYVPTYENYRETEYIPSLKTSDVVPESAAKAEPKQYTGDYIVGIATMHKSNLVPVGRGTDPKDFATMRRN
jgi:primase-polymerase (primpol)-like protein